MTVVPDSTAQVGADVDSMARVDADVVACRRCPRLVAWREEVAATRRASFRDETYWGRAVPSFGPADAAVLVVGLAPAAHGANRTGRMFTGDRSGDVLVAAMHAAGLANQPTSTRAYDGLELLGTRMVAPVHCAPPANKPTPAERDACAPVLLRELELLRPTVRAVVVLGGFGWQAFLPVAARAGWKVPVPRPRFGHGVRLVLEHSDGGPPLTVLGCFHVSQQNTFTGRLTPAMVTEVLVSARQAAGLVPDGRAANGELPAGDGATPPP